MRYTEAGALLFPGRRQGARRRRCALCWRRAAGDALTRRVQVASRGEALAAGGPLLQGDPGARGDAGALPERPCARFRRRVAGFAR